MDEFVAMPAQLEERIRRWAAVAGGRLSVDHITSYSGHRVYALTLSVPSVPRERKRAHYFAQPHAHEPGATAGMVDVIDQLVTGVGADGRPTALDVDRVLAGLVLTFNPIGNPQGREAAPVVYWDGSRYTNDEFWCWMRGEDPDYPGRMWKRLGEWDTRVERAPGRIGIVYEAIDAYRWVEPNRSRASTYFRLFHRLDARHHYDRWLNLHQTEFVGSPYTCKVLLPLEGLARGAIARRNEAWAQRIVERWLAEGYAADPRPQPLGYAGEQAQYFRDNWSEIDGRMSCISTESKNNSPEATPEFQRRSQALAVEVSIEDLLEGGTEG